ncbi:conserved exported hypothetical protein [Rubrivivax sp. A210]|uniref:hypothetical protein n=1 Tax=Rubrivivax sp. A210 TaxID=2772301 RepID=UPI00191A7CDA|nr:hypothetical protein [Rubrivivax sp. A210]CAD5372429.1 conserved exported hypothetical protein [Rubrivivax sp. A210]
MRRTSIALAFIATLAALPALAADPQLSAAQLEAAERVFTGTAACELNNSVKLAPIEGKPGHFKLEHKKVSYTMVSQETSTGAVRLEDAKSGMVWLQIPSKSMLMNAKRGQRVADACLMDPQREVASR